MSEPKLLGSPLVPGFAAAPRGEALTDSVLASMGVGIAHHFSGGVYIKEAHLTRGHGVEQHSHEHDHPAVLVYGTVRLFVEDEPSRILTGFNVIKIAAHKRHRVEVITDALWLCIWPTDDTDPETVDQTILKG